MSKKKENEESNVTVHHEPLSLLDIIKNGGTIPKFDPFIYGQPLILMKCPKFIENIENKN